MMSRTVLFTLSVAMAGMAHGDELRDGRLGSRSEGTLRLTLELPAVSSGGLRFISGSEVVSSLVPEFLASALLAGRTVSFGVCPPGIYGDGYALALPVDAELGELARTSLPAFINVSLDLNQIVIQNVDTRSLTVSTCADTPGAEVIISMRTVASPWAPRVLLGKFILLIKPE